MLRVFCISLLISFLLLPSFPTEARVWNAVNIIQYPVSNMCALTFDDGPSTLTPQLLDTLQEENIPATFYVLGQNVIRYPELILRMQAEGHEIASHGYSHANLRTIPAAERIRELQRTQDALTELGIAPRTFRPPYGRYTRNVVAFAEELGMDVILWSTDSRDWQGLPNYYDMPNILERPMTYEEMRGIFLFHDINARTVRNAKSIILALRDSGCEQFVTVSEYLNLSLFPLLARKRLQTSAGIPPEYIDFSQDGMKLKHIPSREKNLEDALCAARKKPLIRMVALPKSLPPIQFVPKAPPAPYWPAARKATPLARSSAPWKAPVTIQ